MERTNKKNLFKYLGIEVPAAVNQDDILAGDPLTVLAGTALKDLAGTEEKNSNAVINHYHLGKKSTSCYF